MPLYDYTAIDAANKSIKGVVDAESEAAAARRLFDQGAAPLTLSRRQDGGSTLHLRLRLNQTSLHRRDLVDVLSYLSMLLTAGMTLPQAIGAAGRLTQRPAVKAFLSRVQALVQKGQPLSQALGDAGAGLAPFIVDTIKAGELSGQLTACLGALEAQLKRTEEFRSELISALIYPAILFVMAAASLMLLFLVVIPEFRPLFDNAQQSLPPVTRAVLAASEWFEHYALAVFVFLCSVFAGFQLYIRTTAGRLWWDEAQRRAPLGIGYVVTRIHAGASARLLGLLLSNGVPLLTALNACASAVANRAVERDLAAAALRVREGERLAAALGDTRTFPDVCLDLIRVGEDASNLTWALGRVADLCETEVDRTLKRLTAAFVPVITIVMGALIAGVIASVLLALLSANQLAL
ncbi:MAG: type II secretion system F family protein [Hyphomicrobiales bacterium]|nr:type II secretion system F family protein [Hyphomicrobiales bacterium]